MAALAAVHVSEKDVRAVVAQLKSCAVELDMYCVGLGEPLPDEDDLVATELTRLAGEMISSAARLDECEALLAEQLRGWARSFSRTAELRNIDSASVYDDDPDEQQV
jgi:hypothetical protein